MRLRVPENELHARFSRRLQFLTLALGFSAALAVSLIRTPRTGCGVAAGTLLAWLNYRWLDQGIGALVIAFQAQEGSPHPRVPASMYWKFAARYALIGLIVYIIVSRFSVPLLAVVAGLLALGAGATAEGLYEVFAGSE